MECKIVEDITNRSPVGAQRILSKIPCSQEWKDAGDETTHVQFHCAPSDQAAKLSVQFLEIKACAANYSTIS